MQTPAQTAWEFLIVCADATVQQSLTDAVRAVGGTVHHAADSVVALGVITQQKLDGIFIDTRNEGALGLVGNIRRGGSNRFSVIVACVTDGEELSHLLNAGVNFVVHKPLSAGKLEAVLRSASQMIATERRRYLRHPFHLSVVIQGTDREHKAITANISRGGMAVRCPGRFAPGVAIHYVLDLPQAEPVRGRGEIVWSNDDGMVGIRFYLMGEDVKNTLWPWMEQRGA